MHVSLGYLREFFPFFLGRMWEFFQSSYSGSIAILIYYTLLFIKCEIYFKLFFIIRTSWTIYPTSFYISNGFFSPASLTNIIPFGFVISGITFLRRMTSFRRVWRSWNFILFITHLFRKIPWNFSEA